jgi:hypothetical protein
MTSDEQEAESRKHSNDVVILLSLASGKWAIFNAARKLERIVVFPDAFDLKVTAPERPQPPAFARPTFNPRN